MDKEIILKEIKQEAIDNHVPIIEDDSLEYIENILKQAKPNKILEVGTAVGYSAIHFSKYLYGENAKVKTMEIKENMYNKAMENIAKMELGEKIEVVLTDAGEYMKQIPTEEKYDIIFIDAAKGQYLVYLEEAIRLSHSGTIIIADNMFYRGRTLSDYNEHKHRTQLIDLESILKL